MQENQMNESPQPVRKPRADAERNRARILAVARDAFTRMGPDVSMDEVAKLAEVGPGTLYRHFPNRDALLETVYRIEVERLARAVEELSATLPPVEALRAWLKLFVDYMATKYLILPALNAIVGGPSRIFTATGEMLTGAIERLVRAAVQSGDIRGDIDPMDLLRALAGMANVASAPDWSEGAKRMVDILILGSRPA